MCTFTRRIIFQPNIDNMYTLTEYTPEYIMDLPENCVFIAGTNTQGIHGAGSAKTARLNFGAILGQGEGLQGRSYGIITKELRDYLPPVTLQHIYKGVERFYEFAANHPELKFYVTKIGTLRGGFSITEIGDIFRALAPKISPNIVLPREFV